MSAERLGSSPHEREGAPFGGLDLATLLQDLPAVVFVAEAGAGGAWLYVSPQVEQILGLTADEWYAHPAPFAALVDPDDLQRVFEFETQVLNALDKRPFVIDFRATKPTGERLWVQERASLIELPDGTALLQGLLIDVTATRTVENRLDAANRHLRALFDSSPLAVTTWDRDGRILTWNPAAERIFGWTEAEAVGQFLPYVQADAKADMLEFIEQGFAGEVWTELELVRQRKDGTRVDVEISVAALRDERGEIVAMLSILSDITERKRAAELLRTQEVELRQREQLDAIGKLAGGIAHDFNNLLTAIHGQALLALEDMGADDPRAANVIPIVDAAKRASSLTRQLLAFGRRQVLEPRVLSLNAVVESIEPLLRRLAGEGIAVQTQLCDDVPSVEADPTQLDQVLVNLVSNARDAMPRGGAIEIATSGVELARPGQPGRRFTLLTVSDTGIGMDEGIRSRVFDPFFTTKETGKGSGLGLSTVYGIVAQSGGFVELDSELDEGTTFRIYLPAVTRKVIEELSDPTDRSRSGGGGERVLLVEDEGLVRDLVKRVLELEGYDVTAAASGGEVLADCEAARYDLLVSDVVMPGISGPELAARLRSHNPNLAVLFISGYNETAVAGYGALAQTVELLQKPFTPAVLAERVRAVLDAAATSSL
jgi:two-component system, cell cycle sensor histidine kinase and response regulator CckA